MTTPLHDLLQRYFDSLLPSTTPLHDLLQRYFDSLLPSTTATGRNRASCVTEGEDDEDDGDLFAENLRSCMRA
jgi:hypothetical protein